MTEPNRTKITNVRDIVLPITMIGGLLVLAFHGGVQYMKLSYVETTQQKVVATLARINEELSCMKTADALHEAAYPIQHKVPTVKVPIIDDPPLVGDK